MYVIRSMSTTDYAPQYGQHTVQKYHIYLLPEGERDRAYWSTGNRQKFATAKEACDYGNRVLSNGHFQVVPADDRHLPTYWEIQEMNGPHWQTYLVKDHNGKVPTWTKAMEYAARFLRRRAA